MCKQSRDIFAAHPGLVRQVFISSTFSSRALPSLLAWLQQTKDTVQALQSADGSSLDAVLTALMTSGQPIKVRDIRLQTLTYSCARSTTLVSAFMRLEECALSYQGSEALDLTSLRVLPTLNHLNLSGRFKQLHHLTSLSRLVCTHAGLYETQAFALTLQHLAVDDSYLSGIHAHGLSANTALTQLVWRNSLMRDTHQRVHFNPSFSVRPTNLDSLTQLHTLELRTDYGLGVTNLEWVTELTSLQELSMTLCCCEVIQHVVSLTKLTCLKVSGRRHRTHQSLPDANLDIEWHRLQDLQELCICQVMLQLGQGTASLLQLNCLRQISFAGSLLFLRTGWWIFCCPDAYVC